MSETIFNPFNSNLFECKVRRHPQWPAMRVYQVIFTFDHHGGVPGDTLTIQVEPEDLDHFAKLTAVQMQEVLKSRGQI